jgi:hypothetical protein
MLQKILYALFVMISIPAVAMPVEFGQVRVRAVVNSGISEIGCWRLMNEAKELVQSLTDFEPLVSCTQSHARRYELDLVIDRLFEVAESEFEAEWVSFYNSQSGLCQSRAQLIDQVTPVLSIRNLSVGQFCQGESGSVIISGEALRLIGR